MAGYPPPYPPTPPPYGPPNGQDWKYQRRIMRDQARAQKDLYRQQMRGLRRRSILGPVIVILVGVIFLLTQTGHLHSDRVWELYGHWWPLLLVVIGLVLVAEWGVDQFRTPDPQRPYVRRSVGGGVIFLIIILGLVGLFFTGGHGGRDYFGHGINFNSDNIQEFLGDKHESDEILTDAFPAGGALTIDNPRGEITVSGTSTDGLIHLSVHKQVYSRSDADAEKKARDLSPEIESRNNQTSIKVPTVAGSVVDLNLTVPPASNVTLTANHGDIHVDSLKSPLTVTANHGDVSLSAIAGPITAHINNGGSSFSAHGVTGAVSLEGHGQDLTVSDIAGPVTLSGDFYGTTHLEHITSAVRFHTSRTDFQLGRLDGTMEISPDADLSADQAVGPVVLTTRNRNITLERISGDLSVTNRNGSVDLTSAPPIGNVTVQNRNGSVSLTLPDHANFVVNAETSDGDVENDFSLPSQENESRKILNGTIGKGGSLIRINTSQGDVSLKKASIAPLPIAPPRPPVAPAAPQINIKDEDGSSVYVGKDGVRITSGADGSSVVVGKEGLRITANADGSSSYKSKDGTQLTEGADGSKIYKGRDGTHYTESADGGKVYKGSDGTRITISASGSQIAKSSGGVELSDSEVRDRLRRVQDDVRRTEQERDDERRSSRH
ncbi:DUF4097 family beta strand repeat-containing protein [Granulicella arctica]|uniref:DUF4097 family beta strand repeat-containing protein n=1 Tax=Granulicella arctica TaxID=940613 RepID=UPI0021DFC984|nr:DUF4097 domain-containing protein [Granulicella arctica]